jgi:hypothetical protein
MARRRFRDYGHSQARTLRPYTITYYTDARGTVLADVQTLAGVTIPGSTVTVPAGTNPPDVLGPVNANDLWAKTPEGVVPLSGQGPRVAPAPGPVAVTTDTLAPDFAPGVYRAGRLVVHAGGLYRRKADGTAAAWDATEWDSLSGVDEVIEIAYVENATGVSQPLTIAGGAADATLLAVVVPVVARPVYVRARIVFDVTSAPAAAGSGTVNLWIEDDTGAVLEQDIGAIESGSGTAGFVTLKVEARIPANTPQRTYKARVSIGGQAAFAGQILHGVIAPALRSWIKAEKR